MRFKVGNKVRLADSGYFDPKARGKIAEITGIKGDVYVLENIEGFKHYEWCTFDKDHLLELVESAKILPHQMEEGKVYRHEGLEGLYRVKNGVIEGKLNYGWEESYMRYNNAIKGFELLDEPKKLKVETLDHELVKELDGSVKVGCQKISKDDVDKIKKFLEE